ncbi:YheU family protein [Paraferrimonas haliotis]|uniref:YheU family protein n=1 Tax=Paraferrimonas haliotis TaxID=2013866 RepID=UPI000BA9048D|nr:YheU family protein [Paraferrimonas haliotis]
MLIPYQSLQELDPDTLDNLIKEFIYGQVEDLNISQLDHANLTGAIAQCKRRLANGELVVEYSEQDQSVAIKDKEQLLKP